VTIWSSRAEIRSVGRLFSKTSSFSKASLLSEAPRRNGSHENQRNPA
jgi:hypothetical protein